MNLAAGEGITPLVQPLGLIPVAGNLLEGTSLELAGKQRASHNPPERRVSARRSLVFAHELGNVSGDCADNSPEKTTAVK
jgi:hypothetical protein